MKTPYTFVTLRYVHDAVSGEFVNVGVVMYAPQQRYLGARFSFTYERLSALFVKVDHKHYRRLIKYISQRFDELAKSMEGGLDLGYAGSIDELVRSVMPQDDSSLQWSTQGAGLSANLAETLDQLFERFINHYKRVDAEKRSASDIAKPFIAALGETVDSLQEKTISGANYGHRFPYAWKNDVWRVIEPVSFDLAKANMIVEKASQWLGRGMALSDSVDRYKLYLLLGEPQNPEFKSAYEDARCLLDRIPGEKHIVLEDEIVSFGKAVAKEITDHENKGKQQ